MSEKEAHKEEELNQESVNHANEDAQQVDEETTDN